MQDFTASREPVLALETEVWPRAVERGHHFLSREFDRDPPLSRRNLDVNYFCKLPWVFAVCGDRVRAVRALGFIEGQFMKRGRLDRTENSAWTDAVSYSLAWLVSGSVVCEELRHARVFYDEMENFRCGATGAIFSDRTDREGDNAYFDMAIQGASITADVLMGARERAVKTGDLMLRFFREQPDLNIGIYNYFHPDRGYLTEISHENSFQRLFARVGWKQPFDNLGFLLIGLARLYEATSEKRFLDGSLEIMEFAVENHREDIITHAQNHRFGYASAVLYRISGNSEYLYIASQIAARLSANIGKHGRAWADIVSPDLDSQTYYTSLRMTADAVLWLRQIYDLCESLPGAETRSER